MTDDDDALRRALAPPADETNPYAALQMLRPAMKRARSRRRVAMTALTATLVAAGAAGVLAMIPDAAPTSLRTSSISGVDENADASSTVPGPRLVDPVPEVDGSERPDEASLDVQVTAPPATTSEVVVTAAEVPKPAPAIPATTSSTIARANPPPAPAPERRPPVPTTTAPVPTTTAPVPTTTPAPPATTTLQTITSACGSVMVVIDGATVRIDSIQPQPSFEARVSNDGPTSIELEFTGSQRRCELHAELRPDGLDVEVQDDVVEQ